MYIMVQSWSRSVVCTLAVLGLSGCATARHPSAAPAPATIFHHRDGMMGCEEVGLVAETDGCLRLVPACCASVEHSPPTADHATARAAHAATKLGGNAVLILYVDQQDHLKTDCEGCCSVKAYRAYGVVYRCSQDYLQWHLKHEEPSTH